MALVDPKAQHGPGVKIGPFSIVGPEAKLAADVEIGPHVVIEGRVELGAGVRVGPGTIIGTDPQDTKFKRSTISGVRVGAGTVIREYVTIHRATRPEGFTEIGANCLLMPPSERRVLQEAYRLLYRSGLAPGRALERIRGELPATPALMRLVDFVAAPSRRGIIPPKGGWRGAAAESAEDLESGVV